MKNVYGKRVVEQVPCINSMYTSATQAIKSQMGKFDQVVYRARKNHILATRDIYLSYIEQMTHTLISDREWQALLHFYKRTNRNNGCLPRDPNSMNACYKEDFKYLLRIAMMDNEYVPKNKTEEFLIQVHVGRTLWMSDIDKVFRDFDGRLLNNFLCPMEGTYTNY